MSLHDIIRKVSARAVRALSETDWQWRPRTSAADARPPTYGALVPVKVVATSLRSSFPSMGSDETKSSEQSLRVNDQDENGADATLPDVDDQFVDPDGFAWVVTDITSDGPGSRAYTVARAEVQTLGPQRGRRE